MINGVNQALPGKRLEGRGVIFQKEASDCGIAALTMFLAHSRPTVTYDSVRAQIALSEEGTNFYQMRRAALAFGVSLHAILMDIENCKNLMDYLPLIAHLRARHFVVIESVDRFGNLVVLDPKVGRLSVSLGTFVKYSTAKYLTSYDPTK